MKQYQKLFEMENVKLTFTSEAVEEVAKEAITRGVGARGLRMIIEDLMLDLMYEIPSQSSVKRRSSSRGTWCATGPTPSRSWRTRGRGSPRGS